MIEPIGDLIAALVEAQKEFKPVLKTSVNSFFKSNYADLADVVGTIQPTLNEHGLAVSQFPSSNDHGPTLITYLLHTSGQYLVHEMPLFLPKDDPQGQGSAITYARRYAFCAVLGVVADDDDDGNSAARPQRAERPVSQDEGPVEEEDVQAANRFNQLMTEAVDGKAKYGDEWANALRERAQTEGHESVNAWFRADPDAAEAFLTPHKLRAEMALVPVEYEVPPEAPEAAPPRRTRTRVKAGSAVLPPEDKAAEARRIMEAFPGAEFVEEPELDLT